MTSNMNPIKHKGKTIGHWWKDGDEIHAEHSGSGASWAGYDHHQDAENHIIDHHNAHERSKKIKKVNEVKNDSVEKLTAMRFGKKKEKKSYTSYKETGINSVDKIDHEHKSPAAAEKKGKKELGKGSTTRENPKYFDIRDKYRKHKINERVIEGPESAAAYKADTPGQESAVNVPYSGPDNIVNDDIKKIIEMVSKRLMCVKESIRKYGTKWETISTFLEEYGAQGLDELVEHCTLLNEVKGRPLRELFAESINPDELMEEETIDENALKKYIKRGFKTQKQAAKAKIDALTPTMGHGDLSKNGHTNPTKSDKKILKWAEKKTRHYKRLVGEEENITELSNKKLRSYSDKALDDFHDHGDDEKKNPKWAKNRVKGMNRASQILRKRGVQEAEVDEATLGGEKYKGKENPNNKKTKNPGIMARISGHRKNLQKRSQDAIDKGQATARRGVETKNKHTYKRGENLVRAGERTKPGLH